MCSHDLGVGRVEFEIFIIIYVYAHVCNANPTVPKNQCIEVMLCDFQLGMQCPEPSSRLDVCGQVGAVEESAPERPAAERMGRPGRPCRVVEVCSLWRCCVVVKATLWQKIHEGLMSMLSEYADLGYRSKGRVVVDNDVSNVQTVCGSF